MKSLILVFGAFFIFGCDQSGRATLTQQSIPSDSVDTAFTEAKSQPIAIFPQHKFSLDTFSVIPPRSLTGSTASNYKLPYLYTADDKSIVVGSELINNSTNLKTATLMAKSSPSSTDIIDRMSDTQAGAMVDAYKYGCLSFSGDIPEYTSTKDALKYIFSYLNGYDDNAVSSGVYFPVAASYGLNDSISIIAIDATHHPIKSPENWFDELSRRGRDSEIIAFQKTVNNFVYDPKKVPNRSKVHLHRIQCSFPKDITDTPRIKQYIKTINEHIVLSPDDKKTSSCPSISIFQNVWSDKIGGRWPLNYKVEPYAIEYEMCDNMEFPPIIATPVPTLDPFEVFNGLNSEFIDYLSIEAPVVDNLFTNFIAPTVILVGSVILLIAAPSTLVPALIITAATASGFSTSVENYDVALYPESLDSDNFSVYENNDISEILLPMIEQDRSIITNPDIGAEGNSNESAEDSTSDSEDTLETTPIDKEPTTIDPLVIELHSFSANKSIYYPGEEISLCYSFSATGEIEISPVTENGLYLNSSKFAPGNNQNKCISTNAPLSTGEYTINLRETLSPDYGLLSSLTMTITSPPVLNNPPVILQEYRTVRNGDSLIFQACTDADNDNLTVKLIDDSGSEVDGISNSDYDIDLLDNFQCLIRIKKRTVTSVHFKLLVSDGIATVSDTITIDEAYKNLHQWDVEYDSDTWAFDDTGYLTLDGFNIDILGINSGNDKAWVHTYNNSGVDDTGGYELSDIDKFTNDTRNYISYFESLEVNNNISASFYGGSIGTRCAVSSYEVKVPKGGIARWVFFDKRMEKDINKPEILRKMLNSSAAELDDFSDISGIYDYSARGRALDIYTLGLSKTDYKFYFKVNRGSNRGCIYRLRLLID